MKITKAELVEMGACRVGLERFIKQTNGTDEAVEVTSLIGGENTLSDLVWLAGKMLPQERIVRFACDCALINIELIKPYTSDYDIIVEFLRNPTGGGLVGDAAAYAADTARNAAADAAYAADAAWNAADAADTDAAVAAAYAADTAAYAATRVGDKEKVNELLKEMFA